MTVENSSQKAVLILVRLGLSLIISVVFFFYLHKILSQFGDLTQTFQGVTTESLLLVIGGSAILHGFSQWLRAWRLSILAKGSLGFPEKDLLTIAIYHNFLNSILPFKLGEMALPLLLKKKYAMDYATGAGLLVLVRIYDLLFLVAACGICALLLEGYAPAYHQFILFFSRLGMLCAAVFFAMPWLPRLFSASLNRGLPESLKNKRLMAALLAALQTLVKRTRWQALAVLFCSMLIWMSLGIFFHLAATLLHSSPSFLASFFAGATASISYGFPLGGIANVGPLEATWAAGLHALGAPLALALASGILMHSIALGSASLLAGGAWILSRSTSSPQFTPN